jgi:hypothetical protein
LLATTSILIPLAPQNNSVEVFKHGSKADINAEWTISDSVRGKGLKLAGISFRL